MKTNNIKIKKYTALIGLFFWLGSLIAQGTVVQVDPLVDPANIIVNNTTPPLFIELGSLVVDGTTYVRDETIFAGNSGVPRNADGTPVDPNQDPLLLVTGLDDGVNNNSITGTDSWNINNGAGRRSDTPEWETRNFGGNATFTSTNGDGPDFILLEQGANDDLFVQAVLPDGTTGQYTPLIVGDEAQTATWGDTGLLTLDGAPGPNQAIVGVGWKVEDMLGADGNPLSPDAEILGLRFNAVGQSSDTGLDPLLIVAVIQPQGLSQVGPLVDPDNVIVNNTTPPLFIELGSLVVDGVTYVRDETIFAGNSGVPRNADGTPVDPNQDPLLLVTGLDDGVNNNSITGLDSWNINNGAGRRSDTPEWETRNFGGNATFTSTNGDGPDFILLEQGANDDLFVQAVLPDGTTGQYTPLIVGDEAQVAMWGDTGLLTLDGAPGPNQAIVGVGWKVEDMLGADGNPLSPDAEILGLRFNAVGQSDDTGLDPLLLVAVIIGADTTPRAVGEMAGSNTITLAADPTADITVGKLVFLDDGTEVGKIASIDGRVLTLEAPLAVAIAPNAPLTFVDDPDPGFEIEGGGKMVNISTRGIVGEEEKAMIGGFIIREGNQTVNILVRASELVDLGVTDVLADPVLTLYQGQTVIRVNDDWEDDPAQAQLISDVWGDNPPLTPGSTSSGVVLTLGPGNWTAIVTAADGTASGGVVLLEVYEVD